MSVSASDIKIYGSANMPEDNSSLSGGVINSGVRVVFEDIASTDYVRVSGDNTADTGTITIWGRNAAGQIISESRGFSGVGFDTTTVQFERILKMGLDAACVGNITVYDETTETLIATFEPLVTGIRRPFYDVAADAVGGSQRIFYEKVYIRNNNSVNALLSAQVTEIASGVFNDIDFGLESGSLGGSQSVASRLNTAPTGVTTFGNGPTSIPASDLSPASHQAMWLRLTLNAGAAAQNSYYQFKVTGNTT